jgi:hypothetical protein
MRIQSVAATAVLAWLTVGCSTPPAAPVVAAGTPTASQILEACMKVEVPAALKLLGLSERIRSRDDAGIVAHSMCQSIANNCSVNPKEPACQERLRAYGLEGSAAPAAPAAQVDRRLFDAANSGATQTARRLLAEGADPNWRNAGGWTPLMIAAAERHLDTVAVLLEAGADPNLRNGYGRTALMFASSYGQVAIAERLIDAGADVDAVPSDQSGWTALIAASAHGMTSTVELLLRRGADPDIKARNGQTALLIAREQGHADVVRLLEAASRSPS